MAPKGCFRRGRKSMNSMPEGFAFEVVRPVYLMKRREHHQLAPICYIMTSIR